jgi:hypothetical protein
MSKSAWMKLMFDNRRTILSLAKEGFSTYRAYKKNAKVKYADAQKPEII